MPRIVPPPSRLVQFGVLDALLAGVYETGVTVGEVQRLGDFGLGCGEGLGGEVVVLDGRVTEFTADGPPAEPRASESLPFVEVCSFPTDPAAAPRISVRFDALTGPYGSAAAADAGTPLTALVEDALVSRNLFHAVRVDGDFERMRVRVPPRARRPFRPLAEVTREQVETELVDVRGTLVGFWGPTIYQGIAVAGLHLHFLSRDARSGGHVLDLGRGSGDLRIAALTGLDLRLPTDPAFLGTELTHDEDRRIVAIETAAGAS